MLKDIVSQVSWYGSTFTGAVILNQKKIGLDHETLSTVINLDLDLEELCQLRV
ncbi:MAG: hypothetical protein JEZ08_02250, partial [Clostridiales bacterium]|nr:hypothetical protein [Clostridiales bacterium]